MALSYALIGQPEAGPQGQAGAQGQRGATGEQGPRGRSGADATADVDEESVWSVIEADSTRLTESVEGYLDPAPGDVQSELEDLRSDVSSLCSELTLADALSSEYLTCP